MICRRTFYYRATQMFSSAPLPLFNQLGRQAVLCSYSLERRVWLHHLGFNVGRLAFELGHEGLSCSWHLGFARRYFGKVEGF